MYIRAPAPPPLSSYSCCACVEPRFPLFIPNLDGTEGGMRYCGLQDSKYKYDQISEELHCFVRCDKDTTPEDIEFKLLPHHMTLSIKGEERINDPFFDFADPDGSFWELDYECGGNWALHITISKRNATNWSFLFKSEMFDDAIKEAAEMESRIKAKAERGGWCSCTWLTSWFTALLSDETQEEADAKARKDREMDALIAKAEKAEKEETEAKKAKDKSA
jgi:hypothetical protein